MFGILVFGDSISFGRGESPSKGWSGRLKEWFEAKDMYNCLYALGIPGDTSKGLRERVETEAKHRTKYVYPGDKYILVIAIGINDTRGLGSEEALQTTPEDFKKNISEILGVAKKFTEHVVVVGLTPVDESKTKPWENTYFLNMRIKEYDSILKELAEKNNALFIEVFEKFSKENYEELLVDGVHPNNRGYEEMYGIIRNALEEEKLLS